MNNPSPSIVFVVGAGASCEFGLPTGAGLVDDILDSLDAEFRQDSSSYHNGPLCLNIMRYGSGFDDGHAHAYNTIRQGLTHDATIDDFLATRADNAQIVDLTKLAMINQLLIAEAKSPLFGLHGGTPDGKIDTLRATRTCWLPRLFSALRRGRLANEAAEGFRDVGFVTLNYDRCIEQYLHGAFISLGMDPIRAAQATNAIPIHHLYGSIGDLQLGGDVPTGFGEPGRNLIRLVPRVRTYTEATPADDPNLLAIRGVLTTARRVVFIGYGFHEASLKLMFGDNCRDDQHFMGTAYKLGARPFNRASAFFSPRGKATAWETMTGGDYIANYIDDILADFPPPPPRSPTAEEISAELRRLGQSLA